MLETLDVSSGLLGDPLAFQSKLADLAALHDVPPSPLPREEAGTAIIASDRDLSTSPASELDAAGEAATSASVSAQPKALPQTLGPFEAGTVSHVKNPPQAPVSVVLGPHSVDTEVKQTTFAPIEIAATSDTSLKPVSSKPSSPEAIPHPVCGGAPEIDIAGDPSKPLPTSLLGVPSKDAVPQTHTSQPQGISSNKSPANSISKPKPASSNKRQEPPMLPADPAPIPTLTVSEPNVRGVEVSLPPSEEPQAILSSEAKVPEVGVEYQTGSQPKATVPNAVDKASSEQDLALPQPMAAGPLDPEALLREAVASVLKAPIPHSNAPVIHPKTQLSSTNQAFPVASPDKFHKSLTSDQSSAEDTSPSDQDHPQISSPLQQTMADPSPMMPAPPSVSASLTAQQVVPSQAHVSGATQAAPAPALASPQLAQTAMPQAELAMTHPISSAKLIQSVQQSEMRVGLNSAEFGTISIHTSSDRGLLSSEITLGHAELARTINAHLSVMPQVPGVQQQALSVRVETNSEANSQMTGSNGGASQQSSSGKQQYEAGRATHSHSSNLQPWAEHILPAATRSSDGINARLDIRI